MYHVCTRMLVAYVTRMLVVCIRMYSYVPYVTRPGGGGGVLPEKLGGGVRPASQYPYPIYDQNLQNSLPYL